MGMGSGGPRRWAYVVALGLLNLAACGGSNAVSMPSPSRAQAETLMVDGQQRTYLLYRPATADQPAPLVIALHGSGLDAKSLENRSQYDGLAQRQGFLVVYPQGVNLFWNAGSCCGPADTDDVTFIKDLIAKFVGDGSVDSKRVFVVGVSNGAMMAQRLGCELAGQITAIASVSGTLVSDSCSPSRAISILEMHGTADDLIPYEGAASCCLSTMAVMEGWATRDGCPASSVETDSGITRTYTWAPCRDRSMVVLDTILGAGHNWFGPDKLAGEPSATQVTWSFFEHAPPLS
jgi:polyhydroxybutyrate depolymerase